MNTGTLYGVGIGPGDPKLMTFRAAELIRDNEIIALPGEKAEETVAYQIAVQTVEELKQKTFLELPMPMTKDRELLEKSHEEAADRVEECLQKGQNVVFLTLGDPTVYSTYLYVHKRIAQRGYRTELTSGITSFCAVAAKLNIGLVEKAEELHVIPASYEIGKTAEFSGTLSDRRCPEIARNKSPDESRKKDRTGERASEKSRYAGDDDRKLRYGK